VIPPLLTLQRIDTWAYRVPLQRPVRTSFGTMRDRPAVLVCLTDSDGNQGFGEVFCNWPAAGAEHRARLILEDIAELVFAKDWTSAPEMFRTLTQQTEIKVLQTAEPGPFAQAIAGLDMALWDMMARKAGLPLCRMLNKAAPLQAPAYASGIQIDDSADMIQEARVAGFRAFKVKVGFDLVSDGAKLRQVRQSLQAGENLMADANQAWTLSEAKSFVAGIQDIELAWLEEPIRVDAPIADWVDLAKAAHMPLAGGENLLGAKAFEAALNDGALGVIQPDAAKWGGVSGCFDVATKTIQAGRRYCPHFLGAGIGLLASAHILAAAGGNGMLEIDANPNPLRTKMLPGWPRVKDGMIDIPDAPGLGMTPDLKTLATYRTFDGSVHA
jgi:D-galactarolactone cycloisomerase